MLPRIAKRVDQSWGDGDGKIDGEEIGKAFESFVGGGGLVVIQLDESGVATMARVGWTYRKSVPQIAAPLLPNKLCSSSTTAEF
jgi:hypothetical protein